MKSGIALQHQVDTGPSARARLRWLGAVATTLALACGNEAGDGRSDECLNTRHQQVTTTDRMTVVLETVSRDTAIDALATAQPRLRSGRTFARVDAVVGGLATTASDTSNLDTLVEFVRRFGALLVPPGEPIPDTYLQFEQAKNAVTFTRGEDTGSIVFLRQQFGEFHSDVLIGGIFKKGLLVTVAGAIHDPLLNPAFTTALVLNNAQEAADAFAAKGVQTPINVRMHGVASSPQGTVRWIRGNKVIDATTGSLLPDLAAPQYDAFPPEKEEQQ